MKKRGAFLITCSLMFILPLSSCDEDSVTTVSKPTLRIRTEKNQELKVGEGINIVYSTYNTDKGVTFTSSNEEVVTVNEFGEVSAVGVGEATITIALIEDSSISDTINFVVTKNFFKDENGFKNGVVDLSNQEENGAIYVNDGQAQVLADFPSTKWYFKIHLERDSFTNGDQFGRWGVGSFLVDDAHAIGDTMFWFYLGQSGQESNLANVYIGGWRYDESIAGNSETQISSEPIDISYGVDLTIYRDGITHYMVLNYGENLDETIKYTYDVPLFEDKPTYPGIFGQNQVLIGTNYEASNDANVVDEKLKSFQVAESISINNIDNRLIKGKTYKITSTVLPNYTIDKSATYSLVNEVSGVSISSDGLLTISESVTDSEIEVKVISNSNKEVSATKVFNIIDEPVSETTLYQDGLTINDPEISEEEIVTKDGHTYIPLKVKGDKWMVSATFRTTKANEEYGIMSTISGYGEYVRYGVNTSFSVDSSIYFDELNGNKEEVSAVANGLLSSERNELSLFKDGNTYYLFINGNLSKRFTSTLNEETTPVLYSSTSLTINNVSVITEETELTNILNSNPYFIGRYVTKNNNEYVVRKTDLGTATDINWPPVNDYATGIKSTKSYDTNFEISFKMKDIDPLVLGNGDIDSKILVYLKSERVSCSLQFVIKKYDGVNPSVKFCANLNDATWDEYDLPSEFDLMNNETEIRIIRTDLEVELYINGTRVFENERFMRNSNYWGKTTVATPGIGTFKCGVTIVDPQIKVSEK